ncbi:MAG: TolC family protein [Xanthomonadaceae bacterium]|nr:TolC family protein [Xanthomonadaceae bacterium]
MILFVLLNFQLALSLELPPFSDYIKKVNTHYPLIIAADQELENAEGELKSNLGSFDLTLKNKARSTFEGYYRYQSVESMLEKPTTIWGMTGYAGYRLGTGTFPSYDKGETLSQGELFVGLDIPILRNGPIDRRRANLAKSEIGIQVGKQSLRSQRIDVFRIATQRYWEYLANYRRRQIVDHLLKNALDRNTQLIQRVKHGDIAKFEQLENERAILNRQAQLVQANRNLSASILQMSLFLRNEQGKPIMISADDSPDEALIAFLNLKPIEDMSLPAPQIIQVAQKRRPDLLRLQNQLEQNQVEIDLAKNQFLPKLDLQLQYTKDFGTGSVTLQPQQTIGMLALEIPIQWRFFSGRLIQANSQQIRLDAQTKLTQDRVKTEVEEALINLKAAHDRAEFTASEYELAVKLEKGEYDRFKNGDSQLLLVNLREQQTADAALKQTDALLDHHIAIANYQSVTGNLSYWSKE